MVEYSCDGGVEYSRVVVLEYSYFCGVKVPISSKFLFSYQILYPTE